MHQNVNSGYMRVIGEWVCFFPFLFKCISQINYNNHKLFNSKFDKVKRKRVSLKIIRPFFFFNKWSSFV